MKVNFQEFQSSMEKESFLIEKIESRKKTIKIEDVNIQISTLKYIVDELKKGYNNNKSIEEEKDFVKKYVYNLLVNDIIEPTFNDFFIPRTIEYLGKNPQLLKESIKNFIIENKNVNDILKKRQDKTSEKLSENIEVVIASILKNLSSFQYIKEGKFKNFQEKVQKQNLTINDVDEAYFYVNKLIKENINKKRLECYKLISKNPELAYKKMIKNLNEIFSKKEVKSNKINPLISKESFMEQLKDIDFCEIDDDSMVINNFIDNPFYGDSKENDLAVFVSEFLYSLDGVYAEKMYEVLKKSKQIEDFKEIYIDLIRKKTLIHKDIGIKKMLANRIKKLVELQDNIGWLEIYNEKNNDNLKKYNLDGLLINKDKLLKILNNNDFSVETGVALSTFYVNRIAKIIPAFMKALFILDKNGVFEKVKENTKINFDDLNLSQEVVEENMAQYEGIVDLIMQRCLEKYTKKNGEDSTICDVDKLKEYQFAYEKKYGNCIDDFKNVVATYNYKKYFYLIKDFSLSSLIYTVITDQKKKNINWGYVKNDENDNKEVVLLGFDIPHLNTTLFTHIKRKYLMKTVKNITDDCIIPVYEGANDYSNTKRIKTYVLYPITSAQRKYLLKSEKNINSKNTFINHLKWLQNSNLKPAHVNEPGGRLYNINQDKIISNKSIKKELI